MTAFLRMIAAVVFAVFVAAAWATPSEAHVGHTDASAAAAPAHQPSSVESVTDWARDRHSAAVATSAEELDCEGHIATGEAGCCSNVCHAAMSEELNVLTPLPIEKTAGRSLTERTAHSGPAIHVKRPPRRLAAKVG